MGSEKGQTPGAEEARKIMAMNNEQVNIRCSMLSGYADCPRRAASNQWRAMIEAYGYKLRESRSSAGSVAGTATHKAGEIANQSKIDTGTLAPLKDCIEQALVEFDDSIKDGIEWDATTTSRTVAQKQIKSMSAAYYHGVADIINPLAVEVAMEADTGDGFILTGHADVITVDRFIRDTKTGVIQRPHWGQFGGYSLLRRSMGEDVAGLVADYIKRGSASKPQAPVVMIGYDVAVAEGAAWAVVERIKADFGEFRDGGEAMTFMANPMSMLCTERYCTAWGTDFCKLGR